MKGSEKRKDLRFLVNLPINFGHKDYCLSSVCANISRSGLYIETSEQLAVGKKVSVYLPFPLQKRPLKIEGKIVWQRPLETLDINNKKLSGLGLRFSKKVPDSLRFPTTKEEELNQGNIANKEDKNGAEITLN